MQDDSGSMKSHILRILFTAIVTTSLAHANGGGYFRGGAENTGDIKGFEPSATGNIQILDEKLHIKAGKTHAAVEVRYLMKNMTDKKVKVRFGFPIEESFGHSDFNPEMAKQHTTPAYCKNYQITAGGEKVKVKWEAEKNEEKDERMKGLVGWNVSELSFAAGEEIPVMIRFESLYSEESWSVSEDSSSSAAIFRYRLSTAACWHGPIVQGRIVVEADGIDPNDIRVIKPVNRFKKEENRWVWNFENLEPTLADDFEIECQPAVNVYGEQRIAGKEGDPYSSHFFAEYINRGERWSMQHSNYSVKASSTLKPEGENRYDAENVRNSWEDKVWSEGAAGNGVGEWLEITPVTAKPLIKILMKPGFQKDATDLFKANARPKKIRIELNGEHQFDADIPDEEETIAIPVTGYTKPVQKMRLTFTEVYPGSKYEDLCVTHIKLHAKLDREPKIQPAR